MSRLRDSMRAAMGAARAKKGWVDFRLLCQDVLAELSQLDKDEFALREIIRQARQISRLQDNGFTPKYSAVQDLFPELDSFYPLGADGDQVKLAEELTWAEFKTLDIRENQLAHDQERLNYHRGVLKNAEPIWRRNPKWVFGQVCSSIAALSKAA